DRVNWNAARSVTCCTSMSTSKVEPMICVWKKGWTQTAAPAVPQSIAGVGVNVGVMVGVGESVAVGHGPPGHAVEVGVGCGATVTAPSYATEKMLSPSGFASDGSRSSTVVPAETGVQVMCASVPAPLGPGCAPLVTQPKWSRRSVGPRTSLNGVGQKSERPVLPREPASLADAKVSTDES